MSTKIVGFFALLCGLTSAFTPLKSATTAVLSSQQSTRLYETFDTGLGTDFAEIKSLSIGNEANYKQWVNKIKEDNMLNRKYNVIGRVRELNLLKTTVDNGVLSKLEANGVDLATIEKLLPVAESLGLLSLAGNNQQLLVNLAAPLLIEPAPLLIPVVAGALEAGPPAFYLAAAVCGGLELLLVVNDVELPLIGLSAGVFLGLLLVPLTVISGAAGAALASVKK